MYKIHLSQAINKYEFEELIKVFLRSGEYLLLGPDEAEPEDMGRYDTVIDVPVFPENTEPGKKEKDLKNQIKRFLYRELQRHTGEAPDWGILTGVRPVKLAAELLEREWEEEKAKDILMREYLMTGEKARLLLDIAVYQKSILRPSPAEAVGLYVGIPFCPTRCVYCSFPSNQGRAEDITAYLSALHREISFTAEGMKRTGRYPESVYIGGGTPTILTAEQLDGLLGHIADGFDLSRLREFSVEAGRPDTITAEKLTVLKKYGVQRISINPQSMNISTLERIGRAHRPEDIAEAFRLAREAGIPMINTDVIAGLPEESADDFVRTLEQVIDFAPENITVHTLALKRASKLAEIDGEYHRKQGKTVRAMLERAKELLDHAGYRPYYLYRQKQMAGNFENVGYARGNTAGIYNIRIMEEAQTIVALGAGGISKVYYPGGNRLERVPNVSNYEIYIERLDEMLHRKAENIFTGGQAC
ncbi:MAG TPA: coproporphyrinogen dehydrogenase HemZ [Anaerovoracaceae bacterium]|nr:coproporphyrinogen dehydrogenase HemZ [Anaerovoracaceae bacterium]